MARPTTAGLLAAAVLVACAAPNPDGAPAAEPPRAATAEAPPVRAELAAFTLGTPWSRAVALPDGDGILVYSGLDAAKRSIDRIVRIDLPAGRLSERGRLPHRLHDAAGAWIGDTAVLIGGGEQDEGSRDVTAVTGPRAGATLGQIPEPRSDVSAITVDGTTFVLGGYDGTGYPTSVLATTDGAAFRKVADLRVAVRYGAVAASGGVIFVFGGKVPNGQTDVVQRIDPRTGTAEVVATFPAPIGHAVAFTLRGSIYVAGGRVGTADPPATDEVWSFDPTTSRLLPAGRLPVALSDSAAAVVGDRAYLVGGENAAELATVVVVTV